MQGTEVPYFIAEKMIDKEKVIKLAEERLEEGMFLVEGSISKSNVINVFVDSMEGVTIEQCVSISRNIEFNLDRDEEDFELQVSSAGLGQPFKVFKQYEKNIGNEIEVVTNEGDKFKGILLEAEEKGFKLQTSKREKVEGHKKKQLIVREHEFEFENIKSAKNIISFN